MGQKYIDNGFAFLFTSFGLFITFTSIIVLIFYKNNGILWLHYRKCEYYMKIIFIYRFRETKFKLKGHNNIFTVKTNQFHCLCNQYIYCKLIDGIQWINTWSPLVFCETNISQNCLWTQKLTLNYILHTFRSNPCLRAKRV